MLSKERLIHHSKQELMIFRNDDKTYLSVVQNELYLVSRNNNIYNVIDIKRLNDNDLYVFIEKINIKYEIEFNYIKENNYSCKVKKINGDIIENYKMLDYVKKINFDLMDNIKENEKTIKLF
jgi:hypothetical protein